MHLEYLGSFLKGKSNYVDLTSETIAASEQDQLLGTRFLHLLVQLMNLFYSNESIIHGCASAVKDGARSNLGFFVHQIIPLYQLMCSSFLRLHHAFLINCAVCLMKAINQDAALHFQADIRNYTVQLSGAFVSSHSSLESMESHPDITFEFFSLLSELLTSKKLHVTDFPQDIMYGILLGLIRGFEVQEFMALNSAFKFLHDLVSLASSSDSQSALKEMLLAIWSQIIEQFVKVFSLFSLILFLEYWWRTSSINPSKIVACIVGNVGSISE